MHTGKNQYQCSYCDKSFSDNGNLLTHMRTHTVENAYECNKCKMFFPHNSQLKSHMKKHTLESPYQCHTCNKPFLQNCDLISHMKMHTENKILHCHLCDKNFADSMYLDKHLISTHVRILPKKKMYCCKECDDSFSNISTITQHLKTHTVDKSYPCKHCNMSFSRYTDCHTHMMKHTGEILHLQCRHCDKTFSQDKEFQFHVRTHIKFNSYQCCKCGKSSSLVDDINYLQAQNAEKPYMCRKCEKDISCTHMMKHTGENLHLLSPTADLPPMFTVSKDKEQSVQITNTVSHKNNDTREVHIGTHNISLHSYQCCKCGRSSSLVADISYLQAQNAEKPYMCRKCENNISRSQPILHNQMHQKHLTFKGLRLKNNSNLCYINATVNAIFNCKSVINLLNSDVDCEVINMLRNLFNNRESYGNTESLRQFIITHGHSIFEGNSQNDPDEFLRILLSYTEPLSNIFEIKLQQTFTCSAQVEGTDNSPAHTCSEVTTKYDKNIGLQLPISGSTIIEMINQNMHTNVKVDCTKCKNKNVDKSQTDTFTSLPDIIFIQLERFKTFPDISGRYRYEKDRIEIVPINTIKLNNTTYTAKSVIIHEGLENRVNQGHYIAALRDSKGEWIMCDDKTIKKTNCPMEGYIFFL